MTKSIKLLSDIPAGFGQNGTDHFTFIRGAATAMDTQNRSIRIRYAGSGEEESFHYHALVLASGVSTYAPVLNAHQSSLKELQESIADMNAKVQSSSLIVIAGGDPTAVELAGEIGEYRNGAAG